MGAAFSVLCFVINYNLKIDNNNLIKKNKSLSDTIEKLKYEISKRDKILNKEKENKKELNVKTDIIVSPGPEAPKKNESFEDLGLLK